MSPRVPFAMEARRRVRATATVLFTSSSRAACAWASVLSMRASISRRANDLRRGLGLPPLCSLCAPDVERRRLLGAAWVATWASYVAADLRRGTRGSVPLLDCPAPALERSSNVKCRDNLRSPPRRVAASPASELGSPDGMSRGRRSPYTPALVYRCGALPRRPLTIAPRAG